MGRTATGAAITAEMAVAVTMMMAAVVVTSEETECVQAWGDSTVHNMEGGEVTCNQALSNPDDLTIHVCISVIVQRTSPMEV